MENELRGANFTSTDAIVMFRRKDKKKQVVLIEWKYTKIYGGTSLKMAKSTARIRTKIYQHLLERDDCPINKDLLPSFDALFYEPFYRVMRQQFLAHEMEKAHELDANVVSLLHIAPSHNEDFRKITSPELQYIGESQQAFGRRWLEKADDRFISISTEQLFGKLSAEHFPEIKASVEYIYARYAWVH